MRTGNARTWAETTRKADALEVIATLLSGYSGTEGAATEKELLADIARIIEHKTDHRFITVDAIIGPRNFSNNS